MSALGLKSRWSHAFLFLALLSCGYGTTPREYPLCSSLCVIYAMEDSNGVKILSAMEGNRTQEITQLMNYSLPTVGCEAIFDNCRLQCFECEYGEESMCCTLPVINATGSNHLAILQLGQLNSIESAPFELRDTAIISQNSDCITAQVFFPGDPDHRSVACIYTNRNRSTGVCFLKLVYDSTNISGTAEFPEPPQGCASFDPQSLSEFSSIELPECFSPAIFFVAQNSVYTISVVGMDGISVFKQEIPDCNFPLDISYMHLGELHLRLQCSEHTTKLYTACGSHEVVEVFDSRNRSVYQCESSTGNTANLTLQNGLLNVTVSGSSQEFSNVIPSQNFSFMNISYAFCDVGINIQFVFALRNGSIFSLSLTTGKLSILSHDSCNSTTNTYTRGQCYKTRNTTIPNVIGAYDFEDSTFKMANLSCPENPIIANIEVDPIPPLAAFVQISREDCMCPSSKNIQISSTIYFEPSLSPTNSYSMFTSPVTSPSTNESPTETSPVVSNPRLQSGPNKALWALTALILLIVPVIVLFIVGSYKKLRRNTPKEKLQTINSIPLNAQNNPQTPNTIGSSHMAASHSEQITNHDDKSKLHNASSPHSPIHSAGLHTQCTSGNPGVLDPVDWSPTTALQAPPTNVPPKIDHFSSSSDSQFIEPQQETLPSSGVSNTDPGASGQDLIIIRDDDSPIEETQPPLITPHSLVPGTGRQISQAASAPVAPAPAPVAPQNHQNQPLSSSADPITGQRN